MNIIKAKTRDGKPVTVRAHQSSAAVFTRDTVRGRKAFLLAHGCILTGKRQPK